MVQVYKYPSSPKVAACCSAPIDKLLNPTLFKALADQTRLSLLSCLAKCSRPCSVTEISECCSVDFSVVSRHLKILEDANLIGSQKKGRVVWYEVNHQNLSDLLRSMADAIDGCCQPARPIKISLKKKKIIVKVK